MEPHEAAEDALERPVTRRDLPDGKPFLDGDMRDPLGQRPWLPGGHHEQVVSFERMLSAPAVPQTNSASRRGASQRIRISEGMASTMSRISPAVPLATSRPPRMTASPACKASTPWSRWPATTSVRGTSAVSADSAQCRTRPTRSCRATGSSPSNGSSSTRRSGSCAMAPASFARCRIPLESVDNGRSIASPSPTRSSSRSARSAAATRPKPESRTRYRTHSRGVARRSKRSAAGQKPIRRSTRGLANGRSPNT